MDADILEMARAKMAARLANLTDDEMAELSKMNLSERLRWALTYLSGIVPGYYNARQISMRIGRSNGGLSQLLSGKWTNPTVEYLDDLNTELGLPSWFLPGRFDERHEKGPATLYSRLPAHIREFMGVGKNLKLVTEFLELAYLAAEKDIAPAVIKDIRELIAAYPGTKPR